MPRLIKVLGVDPAFSNMGFARTTIDLDTLEIKVDSLLLIKTESQQGKSQRKNSDDLRRGNQLYKALCQQTDGCTIAMVEVPHGSQSARASWALGIALGVLSACPIPIIQLTAQQVKLATVGSKTTKKDEMIEWATNLYPNAVWLRQGTRLVAANEHLADAVATVHAGIKLDEFLQLVALLKSHTEHTIPKVTRKQLLK